jgi:hypothetical protein
MRRIRRRRMVIRAEEIKRSRRLNKFKVVEIMKPRSRMIRISWNRKETRNELRLKCSSSACAQLTLCSTGLEE